MIIEKDEEKNGTICKFEPKERSDKHIEICRICGNKLIKKPITQSHGIHGTEYLGDEFYCPAHGYIDYSELDGIAELEYSDKWEKCGKCGYSKLRNELCICEMELAEINFTLRTLKNSSTRGSICMLH